MQFDFCRKGKVRKVRMNKTLYFKLARSHQEGPVDARDSRRLPLVVIDL